MNLWRELAIIGHAVLSLLRTAVSLDGLPLGAHVVDLGLPVKLRVVSLSKATHALPQTQVLRVDGDTVVVLLGTATDVLPAALLFLQIKTSGVGEEKPGKKHAGETEPRNNVELGLVIDVVVEDSSEQSASLTHAGSETVGGGTDGRGENLTSHEEGDRVGTKLVEKGRDEVHGLEGMDTGGAGVVLVLESRDDEHQEAHEEANLLHQLSAIKFVVDEKTGKVVSNQGDGDVDQIPRPRGQDGVGVVVDDLDELALEELVAVEEHVVAEPSASSSKKTTAEVAEAVSKSGDVVSSNVGLALGILQLLRGLGHLPSSVVDEPEGSDSRKGEGQTEGKLSR